MPKFHFNIKENLASQGLSLREVGDNGLVVEDEEGKQFNFDPEKYLAGQGINPKNAILEYNKPDEALDQSPLSIVDRAKMAVGNPKGQLGFLQKRFKDVTQTDDGFVVKNKGVWQKIDPAAFSGDAWELAADVAEGAAGSLPIIGSVLGAPAGGVLGAGAGAGVGEGLRTSLGKLVGTYQASPEEQLKDIGIESILGLGGEVVGLGAKASAAMVGNSLKNIAKAAAPETKQLVASVLGKTTGVGEDGMHVAFDYADDVAKQLEKYKQAGHTLQAIDDVADKEKKTLARDFISHANDRLNATYGDNLRVLAKDAGEKNFAVNFKTIFDEAKTSIEATGAGKFVESKEGMRFLPLNKEDLAARVGQAGAQISIDPGEHVAAKKIADQIIRLQDLGELRGERAIVALQQINSGLNKVGQGAFDSENAALKKITAQAKSGFEAGLAKALDAHGLSEKWTGMQMTYAKYRNVLNNYRTVLKKDNGARLFADNLVTDSARGRSVQGDAKILLEFTGERGQQLYKDIITKESARRFASWLPRQGLISQLGNAAAAGSAGAALATSGPDTSNTGTLAGAAALGLATSPRAALAAVKYGFKLKNYITRLPAPQKEILLKSPQILHGLFSAVGQAAVREPASVDELLKQAGAVDGQANQ